MNFRPRDRWGASTEPEINLIPFIDVLLVVLIFLMLSTTYSKFTELQLKLPVADADAQRDYPKEVVVAVAADGRYLVNKQPLSGRDVASVAEALKLAAKAGKDSVLIISADAAAPPPGRRHRDGSGPPQRLEPDHLCRPNLGGLRSVTAA